MEVSPGGLKQRILYVITKGNWGGAQRYVFDLACAAQTAGHEVAVAYGEPGELPHRLEAAGVRTISVPSLARNISVGGDKEAYRSLISLFATEAPSVVHLNSSKAGLLGALAARKTSVPRIIFTAHGWAFNEDRSLLQRTFFAVMHAVTVLLSHVTICVSEAVRKDMNWLPFASHKLIVIRNGIRCPDFLERIEARTQLLPEQAGATWIGVVSELHPTKRIQDAILGFKKIAADFPLARLVIIGEGEERDYLSTLITEHALESQVFLLGFVPDARSHLLAFDLFMHTSRSEALAYAVLEAGCAGLPTIATRVGGIPEIITDGEHGLLVPRENVEEISRALRTLLSDASKAQAHGAALKARVMERFSLTHMIEKTLEPYEA